MPRLIRYPGQSKNHSFFYDGFSYHCEWSRNNRVFRCSRRKKFQCPGKVTILDEDLNIDESKTTAHYGHEPDLLFLEKMAFKRELFRRCQETSESLTNIWNNMSLEFPDIAIHYPHKRLSSSMHNYRRLRAPKMPENLRELAERVGQYDPIKNMYIGHCEDANGGIALMFMHSDMREPLKECTALYGDGTFKIRPNNPRDIAQVYTFHLMKNLSGFPAFFFLTNSRTADLYKAMLRQMIQVIPELANLKSISTDFERSIITAVREVLPNARLSGCLFHYMQALRRYWYWKCRIPDEFHNILEYAMSLAYLPAENMEAGFNVVMGLMNYHNVPNADRFNTYFRRQWLPLANVVSVYGRRIRTNNICENFHLHARTFIGIRQGLWLMLEKLGKLAELFTIRYKTAVQTGLLYWSWPADLLRANRDLDAMEPTLQEIGVRAYLEFVVRQRRGRFLPEIENDNGDENENYEEDDTLVDELHRIGLNVFIAQDETGNEFETGSPPNQLIRLAPVQVRLQDLPDDAELNNPFAPNRSGRGRGRGSVRGGAGGARRGAGGRGGNRGAAAGRGGNRGAAAGRGGARGRGVARGTGERGARGRARGARGRAGDVILQDHQPPDAVDLAGVEAPLALNVDNVIPAAQGPPALVEELPAAIAGTAEAPPAFAAPIVAVVEEAQLAIAQPAMNAMDAVEPVLEQVIFNQREQSSNMINDVNPNGGNGREQSSEENLIRIDDSAEETENIDDLFPDTNVLNHTDSLNESGVATANGQEQTLEEDSSNDEININGDSVLNANLMDNASNINENVYSENDQHENNPIRSVDDILAEIGSENQLCLENNPGEADERPVANEIRSVRVSYFERRFGNNSQRREGEASHSAEEPSVTDNHAAVNESSADNNSVVPKKKRRRTPRSKCELLGCEAKFHVLKLNCGHRFCVPCIKNFLTRECPHCRRAIGNYLPPNLQGGERWESDEAQALDTNFYRQVQTERMDLEQRAYDLNVDVDDLINGGEIEL